MGDYYYNLPNGKRVEIDKELFNEIEEMERLESNLERKERYHCCSFDKLIESGVQIGFYDQSYEGIEDDSEEIIKNLYKAIDYLSEAQRDVINAMYFQRLTQEEYADIKGVTQPTVSITLKRAFNNLKKFF